MILENNLVVMQSVNEGDVDAGIAYHYYWYRDQKESGENSDSTELHFFGDQDPGAFVSISGAGVLASSEHADDAQRFVEFLTSTEGQQAMADSYALEYPLNPEATLDPEVKPFDELEPADDRPRHAQRPAGDRADDRGRSPLTLLAERSAAGGSCRRHGPAGPTAAAGRRGGGRAAGAGAARVRGDVLGAHRSDRGVGPDRPARGWAPCSGTRCGWPGAACWRAPSWVSRWGSSWSAPTSGSRTCGTGCWSRRWPCPPS